MIIFDLETTGLLKRSAMPIDMQPRITEFAAAKLDDNTMRLVDELTFLCNPGIAIDPKVTKITGITNTMVQDKPTFKECLDKVYDFFEGEDTLIAHNIAFDYNVLRYELLRLGKLEEFPMPINKICTIKKSMYLQGKKLNLGLLYKTLCGKEIQGAHRAINDVYALTECVKVLRKNNKL
jgi:DNA polymerase III epsilon subunit-like protein